MNKSRLIWKKIFLVPILCMILVLLGAGCGSSAAGLQETPAEPDREEIQNTTRVEADEVLVLLDDAQGQRRQTREDEKKEETDSDEDADPDPDAGLLPGSDEGEGTDTGGQVQNTQGAIDPRGTYTTAEDVALYLHTYGVLPDNFMTKKEARALGLSGGALEQYAPGMCIGGDYFGNREGILPKGKYRECDINTLGKKRGAERLIYSDDGRIYYTGDHYNTFTLLYGEE